jgi:hypothetical protein
VHTDIQPILARHPGLVHRMRFVNMQFELRSSADRLAVRVQDGRASVERIADGAPTPACEFVLDAPAAAWAAFAQPTPAPGYHDVIALIEARHAQLHGEPLGFFRNLFLVKGIVAAVFSGDARW